MSIIAYTQFYDDVMPELPGADTAIVLHHIKRVCNDFYERTMYSRETLVPMTVTATQAQYTAVASDVANFEVARITSVRIRDGNSTWKVYPKTQTELDEVQPDWDVASGKPTMYTQTALDNLILVMVPDTTYTASSTCGMVIEIAKLPLYAGGGIDGFIYEKFAEPIAMGVKARLMRMQRKPWTNPGQAADYSRQFDLEVAGAGVMAVRGYGSGPLRTRPCV